MTWRREFIDLLCDADRAQDAIGRYRAVVEVRDLDGYHLDDEGDQ